MTKRQLTQMRRAGMTFSQIARAQRPPISRQRVQQLADRWGLPRTRREPDVKRPYTVPPIDPVKAAAITERKKRYWRVA